MRPALALVVLAGLAPVRALAGPPQAPEAASEPTAVEAPAEPASEGDAPESPEPSGPAPDHEVSSTPKPEPWLRRWAPRDNYIELGLAGGMWLVSNEHELFDPDIDRGISDTPGGAMVDWHPLRRVAPAIALRVGYYPLRFVGVEAEGTLLPTRMRNVDERALIYGFRGQVVAQLGNYALTPFVLVGGGLIGIRSGPEALGRDVDPALHFGGGLKLHLDRWVLRLDIRDVVSHRRGVDETFEAHHLELLLGASVMLGVREPKPRPDRRPTPLRDSDGDGLRDNVDQCPQEPENLDGYQDDDGCPEQDRDGDTFWDDQDSCPDEPGIAPDGCPVRDTDGDGLLDDVDACIDEPETDNGFEDGDGCPDQLPEALARFTGRITGITFEVNKATIHRDSLPTLDAAVQTLLEYPDVRIEIAGHTDSTGSREHNLELSRKRADAVASYLVGMGVGEHRIQTIGFGPDVPIDTNETKSGRANNRRIEFRILDAGEP